MKKILILFSFIVLSLITLAQTPQVFKYQTVVRDAGGGVYANKIVSFRISIVRDNPTGTSVYVETHNTTTNDFGIVNLSIGSGSPVSGSFGAIDWGTHEHFVKTEIDMLGGTDFQFMGTSQLLSVPYALFAGKSANAADDFDKDSTNEIQTINKTGNTVTLSDNGGSFTDSDNQTLSKIGDSIKLTNGGSVKDNDNQTLSLNGTQLHISNGNSVTIGGTVDLDYDPSNEIQNLSLHNDTISLSLSNYVILPSDADKDTTNELQLLTKTDSTISLSKGGGSVTDTDNQSLSSSKNGEQVTVSITDGNNTVFDVRDNDADSTNELQILSYSNDTLNLSNGNYVVIPLSQIVPTGTCINSPNINPPAGYTYSGNSFESQDYWILESNPNTNRTDIKTVELNGKIYAMGGLENGSISSYIVESYNPDLKVWSSCQNLIIPGVQGFALTLNNKIYLVKTGSQVQEYDPASNTWILKAMAPTSLGNPIACNNKLYFFEMAPVYDLTIHIFDPINNIWSSNVIPNLQIQNFNLVCYNNNIYLIGGEYLNYSNWVMNKLLAIYDESSNTLIYKSYMNFARKSFTTCVLNNRIYVFGGDGSTSKCEYYDVSSNTWNNIPDMPSTIYALKSSINVNNKINVFGSSTSSTLMNYCFDINTNSWQIKTTNQYSNYGEMFRCNNIIHCFYRYVPIFTSYKDAITYYMHCKN